MSAWGFTSFIKIMLLSSIYMWTFYIVRKNHNDILYNVAITSGGVVYEFIMAYLRAFGK